MQVPANTKLLRLCQEEGEGECQQCYCRPMWCLTCMGKWFASRQDQQKPETWLGNRVPCPTCRAKFCILDVCIVPWSRNTVFFSVNSKDMHRNLLVAWCDVHQIALVITFLIVPCLCCIISAITLLWETLAYCSFVPTLLFMILIWSNIFPSTIWLQHELWALKLSRLLSRG